jgi:hypothetical protein
MGSPPSLPELHISSSVFKEFNVCFSNSNEFVLVFPSGVRDQILVDLFLYNKSLISPVVDRKRVVFVFSDREQLASIRRKFENIYSVSVIVLKMRYNFSCFDIPYVDTHHL